MTLEEISLFVEEHGHKPTLADMHVWRVTHPLYANKEAK